MTSAEEPEEGVAGWLLGLTTDKFEGRIVPEIERWFGKPPDWRFKDEYLPESGTAQGAALEFFRGVAADALDTLGVEVVEGEHPCSTYYARNCAAKSTKPTELRRQRESRCGSSRPRLDRG